MKQIDAMNVLAMMADADQRHTAQLVEMIAVSVAVKLAAPRGEEITLVELSQADISEALQGFVYLAEYDENGTMSLRIRAIAEEK